jgi:hypothetical protein
MTDDIGTGLGDVIPVDDREVVLGFIKSCGTIFVIAAVSHPSCNATSIVVKTARSELCFGDELDRFKLDIDGTIYMLRNARYSSGLRCSRISASRMACGADSIPVVACITDSCVVTGVAVERRRLCG